MQASWMKKLTRENQYFRKTVNDRTVLVKKRMKYIGINQ